MITYRERDVYDLRCLAEAKEKLDKTVTVELSVTAVWLFRDLIGLGDISTSLGGVELGDDMRRLNDVLGYRPSAPADELPTPHVAGWSRKTVKRLAAQR